MKQTLIVSAELAEIVFHLPLEHEPYSVMEDQQYTEVVEILTHVAQRMALLLTAIVVAPEHAQLMSTLLRTSASMIQEEVKEQMEREEREQGDEQ